MLYCLAVAIPKYSSGHETVFRWGLGGKPTSGLYPHGNKVPRFRAKATAQARKSLLANNFPLKCEGNFLLRIVLVAEYI